MPLCRNYFLVVFEVVPIRLLKGGLVRDQTVRWAFGVLADGQYDVLSLQPERVSCVPNWPEVFEDLRGRGLEKIRFVSGSESAEFHSSLRTAYPAAMVLSVGRRLEALSALPSGHRRTLLASEGATQQLDRCARRAVRRHGNFSDMASATAFVMDALARAEQRIGVAGSRVDMGSGHLAVAGGRNNSSGPEAIGL